MQTQKELWWQTLIWSSDNSMQDVQKGPWLATEWVSTDDFNLWLYSKRLYLNQSHVVFMRFYTGSFPFNHQSDQKSLHGTGRL